MSPEPATVPEWHVTVWDAPTGPARPVDARWRWPGDAVAFVLTTAFVALSGGAVGLLWEAVAPKLALARVVAGSEPAVKADIGADVWFMGVGLAAGVACALVALVVAGRGPGVLLGLAAGGILGALVAAQVGYLADHAHTLQVVHHFHLTVAAFTSVGIDPFFRLRAHGALVAWPLASVVVHAVALALSRSDD